MRTLKTAAREHLESFLNKRWYGDPGCLRLLAPLAWLYSQVADRRRDTRIAALALEESELRLPTIVVGNVVSGGTGKTPVVRHIVESLLAAGARPGVITRGYGGAASSWPRLVSRYSNPEHCGDEAVELARVTGCPVVAGPNRRASIRWLQQYCECDVVVSDDGLQHYAMPRDFEVAVVDALRNMGNGRRLPVGPLREPPHRLATVDLVVVTGSSCEATQITQSELYDELRRHRAEAVPSMSAAEDTEIYPAVLQPVCAEALIEGTPTPIGLAPFAGKPCNALSGIGNPERFHEDLRRLDCEVTPRVFADHASYENVVRSGALQAWAEDRWVVTTHKDAVKLRHAIAQLMLESPQKVAEQFQWVDRIWVLERKLELSSDGEAVLDKLLTELLMRDGAPGEQNSEER